MKIDSYAVTASSEREYLKVESNTTLIKQVAVPIQILGNNEPENNPMSPDSSEHLKVDLSTQAKNQIAAAKENHARAMRQLRQKILDRQNSFVPRNPAELKLSMVERLLSALTGKNFSARYREAMSRVNNSYDMPSLPQANAPVAVVNGTFIQNEAFAYERESVSYQAQGVINTSDGNTITVDINMNMSREYVSYELSEMQMVSIDPLVINYGGSAASLTGEKFDFDLDMDGKMDSISMLGEGSGFLALDKNGDGVINDGSELFGPQSGSGFSELRKYDSDGNSWIDENDDIWSELRVWSKDKDGNDQLFSLLEVDIGAIFLGDVSTEFSMNGENNESYGTMRSTSFFLKESGGSGLVHHIDMTL